VKAAKVYDKAKYHLESEDFPAGLPEEQAFVHTGLFWGWLMERDLLSQECLTDFADVVSRFKKREITGPRAYAIVGGVLADDMLSEEGRRFADAYFDFDTGDFLSDYHELLVSGLRSDYDVQDTWENYDKLGQRIDERFAAWQQPRH
jgi:hypothetical protein